ncbi:hypothetical protein ABFX02_10G073000 [Erythranthe guttata]
MTYTFYCVGALLLLHLITCHHQIVIAASFTRGTISSSKLSLRLIHRHSITPPPIHRLSSDNDDIRAPLIPMEDTSLFLVNISIGHPPVPQLLAMDTGSNLIWVHCTRCDSCKTKIFDPKRSSTYIGISNSSRLCQDYAASPSYNNPQYDSQCSFGIRYEDNTASSGVLALEKFTFLTSTGGTVEIPNVVLGCTLEFDGGPGGNFNGIFGLEAPNEHHFVSRTGGNRFSYCLGSIRDTSYIYNQLILGSGAIIQGMSTPMSTRNNHYFVTIEGISVGDKQLAINEYDFYYNAVIDTGTTFTELVKSAYVQLVEEVRGLMDGLLEPAHVGNGDNMLCYLGDLDKDLKGFPIVSLHLSEGVDIDLDVEGMFQKTPEGLGFCMAVVESKSMNVIGVMAQQYYNVGFNLDNMRVSFQRIDCELLED